MERSTVYYADNKSNNALKKLHNKPTHERLIGSYEAVNQKFDGNLKLKINELKSAFREKLNA